MPIARGSIASAGFGAEVHQGMERGTEELIRTGYARRTPESQRRVRADLIGTFTHWEVARVGERLAAERGLAFQATTRGRESAARFWLDPARKRPVSPWLGPRSARLGS